MRNQTDIEMLYNYLEENGEGGGWSRSGIIDAESEKFYNKIHVH